MSDADLMIAGLANIFGVDREKLAKEIDGPSALATIARQLLGIARTMRKSGAPADDEAKWRDYVMLNVLAQQTGSIAKAIRILVEETGGENGDATRGSAMQRRFSRAQEQWGRWDDMERPGGLADLFIDLPKDGQN